MKNITTYSISAYILAGGESRRFGGNSNHNSKGMQTLDGKPLIAHSISRLKPQLDTININTHLADFSEFNYPLVGDDDSDHSGVLYQGPLSGLLASMRHLHANYADKNWLLLTPCDSPFLPENLIDSLINEINIDQHLASCISYQGVLQPTFSLWHKSLLSQIEDAVLNKQWGGLKIFFKHLADEGHVVEYPEQRLNPFLNINNHKELKKAEQLIRSQPS